MKKITLVPVGEVIQVKSERAKIKIYEKFEKGLKGIDQFSHLIVLFWFHKNDDRRSRATLLVHPKKRSDLPLTGVFATRSPVRPNLIGLCVVRLLKIEKNILAVDGLDALGGTPIIDIKAYVPHRDAVRGKVPEWVSEK